MAIDQTGQNRIGRQVDHTRAVGDLRVCPGPFDALAADDDDGIWGDGAVHRVEELAAANRRRRRLELARKAMQGAQRALLARSVSGFVRWPCLTLGCLSPSAYRGA